LLFLIALQDQRYVNAGAEYRFAEQLFLHGQLETCQRISERDYRHFQTYEPAWAERFHLLEAEAMVWRGLYKEGLGILQTQLPTHPDPDETIRRLTLESITFLHLQNFSSANESLAKAEVLCANGDFPTCGGVLRARGALALERGQPMIAQQFFVKTLSFARAHSDRWMETTALVNLGFVALQTNHFDEALDWSTTAHQAAIDLRAESLLQTTLGNLGWAYFELGDTDRSLQLFLDAETRARNLGNIRDENKWLTTAGSVYQVSGDLQRALEAYQKALALGRLINSKQDIVNSLEVLAHLSIETGKLDEAEAHLDEVTPLVRISGNHLDALDVMLARGKIAEARGKVALAETILRQVENDPDSQTSMRLGSEHELARLFESQGNMVATDRMYRTALTTFESARNQLKSEASKLPFLANATGIYDDYIHFLVSHGKTAQALEIADQSRARTLAQGLGLAPNTRAFDRTALQPGNVAQKAGATLLFYWLGQKESYLWAITPTKTALFPLPAQSELTPKIERYREALLGPNNAADLGNADGNALYQILIAPARRMIPPDSTVAILSDGVLSQLNFETLIVPGMNPHYWIEDATLISAPSLSMLASARPSQNSGGKMLLIGDAVSPSADYPELPMAAFEVRQIRKHFSEQETTVIARQQASPNAYMSSTPQQYSYIHFVAHGVSSRTDPLDSAIILSRTGSAEDSFKLYAREIIQRPIHARLVTISACYGSGTRSYAGEGLVGLSWAFLRAGAHNVIGALWEVSDESTPRLMDTLYEGVESGLQPSAALRQAKLALLHSQSGFNKPFFWAPFQIYTGL
jgi:CHAT domain-containing protein